MAGLFIFILIVVVFVLWLRVSSLQKRFEAVERELRRLAVTASSETTDTPAAEHTVTSILAAKTSESKLAPKPKEALPQSRSESFPDYLVSKPKSEPVGEESKAAATLPPTAPKPAPVSRSTPQPDLAESLAKFIKRIGPNDPNMSWEMALGTYWLPRVGVVMLSIAVVFLLTVAWQKWGPPPPEVRVGIAYAICFALLLLGWRLEKKYAAYARVLYGGGIAGTYFVTFATYYVPFARIFDSPIPSLIGLAIVVLAWGGIAQRRHSAVVGMLVTFLAHLTIGIATLTAEDTVNYAVTGIVLLSIGSAFFLLRNRWYYVAAVGLIGSYINHFLVLRASASSDSVAEFALGMTILTIYLLIFALAELFAPERIRRERVPLWFRTAFVMLNTGAFFILGASLVVAYSFTAGHRHLFEYILAAVLVVIGLLYLRRRNGDPLFNVYMTKAIAIASWGLAAQFNGNTLTTWLAIETVALLYAARRSGLLVTRVLALFTALAAFWHGAYTILTSSPISYEATAYWSLAIPALLTVLAFWLASQIYQRTDWEPRSPVGLPLDEGLLEQLWKCDFVARPNQLSAGAQKPIGGLLYPHAYALAGAFLAIGYVWNYIEPGHRALAFSLAALATVAAARMLHALPFGVASCVFMVFAWAIGFEEIFSEIPVPAAAIAIASLFAAAVFSERRYVGTSAGLAAHQSTITQYVLYAVPASLLALLLAEKLALPLETFALAAAAIGFAVLMPLFHSAIFAICAVAFLLWAQVHWHLERETFDTAPLHYPAWLCAALWVVADRFFNWKRMPELAVVCVAALWFVLTDYAQRTMEPHWVAFTWSLIGAALLAYGLGVRSRAAAAASVASAVAAAMHQLAYTYAVEPEKGPLIAIAAGYLGPIALFLAYERLVRAAEEKLAFNMPFSIAPVLVGVSTLLAVLMLERIPLLAEFFLTISWSGLGVLLFALALVFREKMYRYAGLCVLLLASLRVVIVDTRELEALYKVGAWAVLGIILLALGFGYVKAVSLGRAPAADE